MTSFLRRLHHPEPYRGWTMVAVAFVAVALVFGATSSTLPLIYGAVDDEFGWTRTETTLLYTYKNAVSAAVMLLLVGPMLVRFGLRLVMVAAFVLTSGGMMGFLVVETLPVYYAMGACLGFGTAMAMVATNVFISRWFSRNQGLALGIALAGISVGGAVFPLLAAPLIESIGWRAAMASLSVSVWLVALPVYLWKARENPTDEELAREPGAERSANISRLRRDERAGKPGAPLRLIELIRERAFRRTALAVLLIAAADTAVVQHTPLLLAEYGLDANLAAMSLSVMFAFGIAGKILGGKLFDALSIRGMCLWYLFVAVSISFVFAVTGLVSLIVFSAARGLAHGGLIPKPPVLAKHCYGARLMNFTLPLFLSIWLIGAGIGPVLLAMTYDLTGRYVHGLLLLIAFCFGAIVLLRDAPSDLDRRVRGHGGVPIRES
jgi:MFS family permease